MKTKTNNSEKIKSILAGTIITGALSIFTYGCNQNVPATDNQSPDAIRPFRINVPEDALVDLRRRISDTRWPDKETVADQSQGVKLAKLQKLVQYWGRDYDWRKAESKLNALPQFITTIDGLDIQFVWVRSKNPNAMPLIITHGWPGSVFELLKVIGPLTDPTAYGGSAEDAFDLVIPSLPGFGFSGKPQETGWGPDRIARVWDVLMKRLGYTNYVSQGGDWGAVVTEAMGRQAPEGLRGIHLNLPATVPIDIVKTLNDGGPAPSGLSERERLAFERLETARKRNASAYFVMMTGQPQTLGYGITESPAGLAAWLLGHPGFYTWTYGEDPNEYPTKDDVLDDITLYWLTNSAVSSARLYWENAGRSPVLAAAQKTTEINLPVAVSVFMEDGYIPPETWARSAFPNVIYFHEVEKGGHFAAWQYSQLFAEELRAAFRSLR